MKVFTLPKEVPAPVVDYANFDLKKLEEAEKAHSATLKDHLVGMGYNGPHTGKIVCIPHADSHAQYMIADAPKNFVLIHLPYCDAWDSPWARKLTKAEAIKNAEGRARINAMFGG
jgi:hypothetical protein